VPGARVANGLTSAAALRGTVTLMFTDIEGSTALLERLGSRYADVLYEHRRIVREVVARHGGREVDHQGDGFFLAFPGAGGAVAAARELQASLGGLPVRVRIGVHTGEPDVAAEGYVGLDVHRAARICAAAHGGQVIVSEATAMLLSDRSQLMDPGLVRLKDLSARQRLYQLGEEVFPPPRALRQTNLPHDPRRSLGAQRETPAPWGPYEPRSQAASRGLWAGSPAVGGPLGTWVCVSRITQ
jgi:class 3 adenylate cyclase